MNMPRKLALLGLAVLAAASASAATVSGAQAGTFTAGAYPATVKDLGGGHFFLTQLGLMQCGTYLHGEMTAASSALTLTPSYGTSCKVQEKTVHVNTNGCDFRLHAGNKVEVDLVAGTMDIVCPAGKAMDFEVTMSPVCHLTIPAQEGLSGSQGPTYRNRTGLNWVDLTLSAGGVKYTLDAGCPSAGSYSSGSYSGASALFAYYKGLETTFSVD